MPVNITDVDTFTDPIVAPADSDPADRTYVLTIAQGLANRTRSLVNRYGTDNVPLLSPVPDITRVLSLLGGKSLTTTPGGVPHWDLVSSVSGYRFESTANDGDILFPVNDALCGVSIDGATTFGTITIKSVNVYWRNGAARTGSDRPQISLIKQTAVAGVYTSTVVDSVFGPASASPAEHSTTLTLGTPQAMGHLEDYFVKVTAGNDGASNADYIYRVMVTASATRVAL
jgi:hypothetical protein